MKKIVLYLMGLFFLIAVVSAYQVNIDAPDTLAVGKPLIVTGTTTFGIGTPIDVVLYNQLTTTSEIQRKISYVQEDKTFRAVFDTTGLKKGMYKVEVPANGLGNSVTMRLVQLIDRSDEIFLSSPKTQYYNGKIYIAGTIQTDENSGIQIEVVGSDNSAVFGPAYVNTNNAGDFAVDVPVRGADDYVISFTDAKGYVGSRTISVLGERPSVTATAGEMVTPIEAIASAHTRASRDHPAFFIVRTGSGPVTLYTSSTIDWVIEYFNENGVLQVVNNQGEFNPEMAELQGKGKTVYVKVYPYRYGISGDVFLFGENVNTIVVSPAVPAPFASTETPVPPPTQKSSILPCLCIIAICLAMIFLSSSLKK
ncbi:hypothetical protein [uncultured Methanoregula sp.]|uniref:hypothetical protein n=1 Tax=uncultured Methanoregula sp. TaxID=1005933 RepID=UPI002AAC195F|nr:hypothetical protein [uncultured Methanoregula sp.]